MSPDSCHSYILSGSIWVYFSTAKSFAHHLLCMDFCTDNEKIMYKVKAFFFFFFFGGEGSVFSLFFLFFLYGVLAHSCDYTFAVVCTQTLKFSIKCTGSSAINFCCVCYFRSLYALAAGLH